MENEGSQKTPEQQGEKVNAALAQHLENFIPVPEVMKGHPDREKFVEFLAQFPELSSFENIRDLTEEQLEALTSKIHKAAYDKGNINMGVTQEIIEKVEKTWRRFFGK